MAFLDSPPDPAAGGGFQSVRTGLAETLFRLNHRLEPEGWLALSAERPQPLTWELALRPNVTFHDGAPMTAEAVKASLERALSKPSAPGALLDIARIQTKGAATLAIETNGPVPTLPGLLSDPSFAIVNAAAAAQQGEAFADRPVMTGPYKVVSFQSASELVVARHEQHWGGRPASPRVVFSYLPDASSRALALQAGDIDIADYVSPESVTTLQANGGLEVRAGESVSLVFLYLNQRREPWQDVRVRRAVASALGREALTKAALQGRGSPAQGMFPPSMLRCEGTPLTPPQVDRARQLLAESGFTETDSEGYLLRRGQPLTMTLLTYRQRPELPLVAEAAQASLKAIGVRVTVRMVESIGPALRQPDWDAATYFNNMATTGDPYWALWQFFSSGGSANAGGYANAKVDVQVQDLARLNDRAARLQAGCAAAQLAVEDVAVVPLMHPLYNYGVSKAVTGFDRPHPFFMYLMDGGVGRR